MAIQLSPGVNVSEIDLTTTVPGVATSIGAIAGSFQWGPVLEVRTISSEVDLVSTFQKPNNTVADTFFSAANFLSYSNALRVVRNVGTAARNSTVGASGISGLTITTAGVSNSLAPSTVALTFTGGGGSGAVGTATLAYSGATGVVVTTVSLTNSGTGYTTLPTITLTGATGFASGAAPVITASTANTVVIKNTDDYQQNYISGLASAAGVWTAKYPGELGDSLKVSMCDSTGFSGWTYASAFNVAPSTSTYAANNVSSLDELHIIVIDEDGKFTGTPNTVLEKYSFVSKASDAKTESGESNYYANVINTKSAYIWWTNHPRTVADWGTTATAAGTFDTISAITNSLNGGVSADALTAGQIQTAYDIYKDADTIDVNLFITGSVDSTVGTYIIQTIVENRGDAVAFLSPPKASVVNNKNSEVTAIATFRNALPSSSYAVLDSGWKYQYDKYNDVFRYVPLNGDTAGLCARTDQTNDPWFSPAGFNRGNLKNVVKLAFNPNKANRDDLFKIGVNPVVTFPGQGTVLFGDKTLLSKPSAFDRINVRRLFNVLKKSISESSKFSLFELNDTFTRGQFVATVEPFLRDVQGRRGITDFKVVCDETNNTPKVIDSNSFVGDIYIKPARSISFIQLSFVAVRTGVEFSEIIGQF